MTNFKPFTKGDSYFPSNLSFDDFSRTEETETLIHLRKTLMILKIREKEIYNKIFLAEDLTECFVYFFNQF